MAGGALAGRWAFLFLPIKFGASEFTIPSDAAQQLE
jgi:hypothetical protein